MATPVSFSRLIGRQGTRQSFWAAIQCSPRAPREDCSASQSAHRGKRRAGQSPYMCLYMCLVPLAAATATTEPRGAPSAASSLRDSPNPYSRSPAKKRQSGARINVRALDLWGHIWVSRRSVAIKVRRASCRARPIAPHESDWRHWRAGRPPSLPKSHSPCFGR